MQHLQILSGGRKFQDEKYSHYCFFFSTFMEKTREKCDSCRPVKEQKQRGEQPETGIN